ncbi:MAG TPA: hypothetical protein VLT32_20925, partial [Candidatus Sulfomarinibacteraceae bacterium]|nr:hypothetical protein [Candidatus Sulfomarinibacteraceae bacterium]
VGTPVRDIASPPTLFCDSRAAHRVFLDAGLGREVANSFLGLAGRCERDLERWIDPTAVAWHFASERRRRWRRFHVVRREGAELRLVSRPIHDGERPAPAEWMQQRSRKEESYVLGRTMEQEALEACRRRDVDGLRAVLASWHQTLLRHEQAAPLDAGTMHPYAADVGAPVLPPEFFDISLSNFVDAGREPAFVDREWRVGSGVDAVLARFRALWYLALDLVVSGTEQPFEPVATVTEIAHLMAGMIGVAVDADLPERFFPAEAEVQAIVTGADAAAVEQDLRRLGATTRSHSTVASTLPVNRIRRDLIELGESVQPLRRRIEELEAMIGQRDLHIGAVSSELNRVADWARSLESELGRAQRWATELNELAGRKFEIEEALRRDLAEACRQVEAHQAEAERLQAEAERLRSEREAVAAQLGHLERRSQRLARELEQHRAWEAKWTRKPLVRAALAIHRLLGAGDTSH